MGTLPKGRLGGDLLRLPSPKPTTLRAYKSLERVEESKESDGGSGKEK